MGFETESSPSLNVILAIGYFVLVKGGHTNFQIELSFGVEVSELYPDIFTPPNVRLQSQIVWLSLVAVRRLHPSIVGISALSIGFPVFVDRKIKPSRPRYCIQLRYLLSLPSSRRTDKIIPLLESGKLPFSCLSDPITGILDGLKPSFAYLFLSREEMGYIGSHGIQALHRYKYSGVDHSYVAKYVLQPFWSRCVYFFPLWMPPNMITLTGFFFLLTSALLGYIYSPQLDTAPPRWVHFAHRLLLFLYQTFMLLMGSKHGELTLPVHWASCLTMDVMLLHVHFFFLTSFPNDIQFEAMAFGSTAMCGKYTFWFWVISAIPFYLATWESYFTNTLILPVVNGPTEGLMLIYLAHFFTAIVGAEWWSQDFGQSLPIVSWVPFVSEVPTFKAVLYLMIAFAVIPTIGSNVMNVNKVVQARKGGISMALALAMIYPFMVLMGGILVWGYLSPSDVIGNYPHLVVLGTGLAFGFLVGRMILAHLCDEPKGLKTNMCMSLLYLPLAVANALTAKLNDGYATISYSSTGR
ncbi:Choline/ethanolaminephosphotransferase 1 [Linum perenne]